MCCWWQKRCWTPSPSCCFGGGFLLMCCSYQLPHRRCSLSPEVERFRQSFKIVTRPTTRPTRSVRPTWALRPTRWSHGTILKHPKPGTTWYHLALWYHLAPPGTTWHHPLSWWILLSGFQPFTMSQFINFDPTTHKIAPANMLTFACSNMYWKYPSPILLKGPRQRKRKGREREGSKLPKSWSVKAKPSTALKWKSLNHIRYYLIRYYLKGARINIFKIKEHRTAIFKSKEYMVQG